MFAANLPSSKNSGVAATYWRIHATAAVYPNGYGQHNSFWTISFFQSLDGSGTDENIGASAIASSQHTTSNYAASNANDGNESTQWATAIAQTAWPFWGVVYASPKTIRSIKLYTYTPQYHSPSYALQYSLNGTTWVTVNTISVPNTSGAILTFGNLQ